MKYRVEVRLTGWEERFVEADSVAEAKAKALVEGYVGEIGDKQSYADGVVQVEVETDDGWQGVND